MSGVDTMLHDLTRANERGGYPQSTAVHLLNASEHAKAVWLQPVRLPDALNRAQADAVDPGRHGRNACRPSSSRHHPFSMETRQNQAVPCFVPSVNRTPVTFIANDNNSIIELLLFGPYGREGFYNAIDVADNFRTVHQ